MHVDFLEDKVHGNLYKIVTNPRKYRWYSFLSGYPSSVSKINQLLSFIITIVWGIVFYVSISFQFSINYIPLIGITISIVFLISLYIFHITKSNLNSQDFSKSFIYRDINSQPVKFGGNK
jgi:hypothetical protein